jgi:hypothetical protein
MMGLRFPFRDRDKGTVERHFVLFELAFPECMKACPFKALLWPGW